MAVIPRRIRLAKLYKILPGRHTPTAEGSSHSAELPRGIGDPSGLG